MHFNQGFTRFQLSVAIGICKHQPPLLPCATGVARAVGGARAHGHPLLATHGLAACQHDAVEKALGLRLQLVLLAQRVDEPRRAADRALLDAAPRGTADAPLPSRLAVAEDLAASVVAITPASPPGTWPGPKDDPVCPPDVRTAFAAGRMTLGEAWTARREAVEVALCDELLATAGPVERQEAGARAVARAAQLSAAGTVLSGP